VYQSEFSTETGLIECIYNYKRGFIKLSYMIRGWRIPQWLSQIEETGKPVAAQSMKREASEQECPKMQPQPKGLEAPWRVTGEFMFKAEEAGV
jgi:hypothetical protein